MSTPVVDLAERYPWLRSDPSWMLGDPRPRTFKELMKASAGWHRIYREWLGTNAAAVASLADVPDRFERMIRPDARMDPGYAGMLDMFGKPSTHGAFTKAIGDLKNDLRANARNDRGKVDQEKLKRAGKAAASAATGAAMKQQAGTTDVNVSVLAVAQIERYKTTTYALVAGSLQSFTDAPWGEDPKAAAVAAISDALEANRAAEGALRMAADKVLKVDTSSAVVSATLADSLFQELITYGGTIAGLGQALNHAAELVVEWSQTETKAKLKKDFDAYYKHLSSAFLAARTFCRITNIVLDFFPPYKPIGIGLDLADKYIEKASRALIVTLDSRKLDVNLENAGRQMTFPPDFDKTVLGKIKKGADQVTAVRDKLVDGVKGAAKGAGQQLMGAFLSSPEEGDQALANLGNRLTVIEKRVTRISDKGEDVLEVVQDLDTLQALVTGEELIGATSVTDLIFDELGNAVPAISTVKNVLEGGLDIGKTLINQQKVLTAVIPEEERLKLVTVISSSWEKRTGDEAIIGSIDMDDVHIDGKEGDTVLLVTIANVKGRYDLRAQRFSVLHNERRVRWMRTAVARTHGAKPLPLTNKDGVEEHFVVDWELLEETGRDGDHYLFTTEATRTEDNAVCVTTLRILPPDSVRLVTAATPPWAKVTPAAGPQRQLLGHHRINLLTGKAS